jgi:hypothetical protein
LAERLTEPLEDDMNRALVFGCVVVLGICGVVVAQEVVAPAEPKVFTEGVKIELDGRADMNGNIHLVFQPNGEDPVEISVGVVAKMRDKDIGDDIAKELQLAIGPRYKLKARGEKLEVETASKQSPPFHLSLSKWTVMGVSFRMDKS